jgi:VIT1/CCC1 family predicted Fe2+/Mn2+ transporter
MVTPESVSEGRTCIDAAYGKLKTLQSGLTYLLHERQVRSRDIRNSLPSREISKLVDRFAHFIIAITGGVFLVVPMIIMTLRLPQTKSLVTVSVGSSFSR